MRTFAAATPTWLSRTRTARPGNRNGRQPRLAWCSSGNADYVDITVTDGNVTTAAPG